MKKDVLNEVKAYSLKDLKLIIDTQKDLYSLEEMDLIKKYYESKMQKYIKDNLPKSINCPKCDAENNISNSECEYCGCHLDTSIYYDKLTQQSLGQCKDEEYDNTKTNDISLFRYIISFFIPLVGFIMGAIMLASKNDDVNSSGRTCIIIGLISMIISFIIYILIR